MPTSRLDPSAKNAPCSPLHLLATHSPTHTMAASTSQPQAVTLLLLDRVLAAQEYEGQTVPLAVGTCAVDLVSLSSTVEDAYLLLKIDADAQGKEKARDGFEMILSTEQIVELQPGGQGGSKYKIQSSEVQGATISLTLPPGNKDEEAFQEIIEQYCGLLRAGSNDRGRVELVDEMGNVIGSLDRSIQPSRSSEKLQGGAGAGSDLLLIHDDDDDASSFYSSSENYPSTTSAGPTTSTTSNTTGAPPVTQASAQEKDWLINGAQYVSKGLIGVTGWLGGTVEKGANRYTAGKSGNAPQSGSASPAGQQYLDEKSSTGYNAEALSTDYPAGGPGVAGGAGSGTSTPSGARSSKTNVPIHPSIAKGLSALSSGSGRAVSLSGSARKMILDTSDSAGRRIGGVRSSTNKDGTPRQPGTMRTQLQRGATAANIVLEGFDTAVGGLLNSVGASSGKVVGHTFGAQAESASGHIGQVGKNCFLVYKDVSGVRRKVLLKLAGGTLKGRTVDGQEIEISASPEQGVQGGDAIKTDYAPPGSTSGAGGNTASYGTQSQSDSTTSGLSRGQGSLGGAGLGSGVGGGTANAGMGVSGKVPAPALTGASTTAGPPGYNEKR
ncbi:hypothetical protein BCV69DRAFT_313249 [Microstroma glucosiphilum]|uniref:Senescence domain-containing protein n=1 Tax=Pseudomicrostroma glucosiphilum TaxID=1684307 RepID=A0A316U440_9BASI|nr:hypothetical protein BCV69DRAFT_313249 [Pseudomicrostroma glucosiphilum]PWN20049.1 hypothetical protein BCV69DRAFT_313249 [Pseudomicrostroma glucosiphilum]